jgi:hypothetical protein
LVVEEEAVIVVLVLMVEVEEREAGSLMPEASPV